MFQIPGNYSMAEYSISYLKLGPYPVIVIIPTFVHDFNSTFLLNTHPLTGNR